MRKTLPFWLLSAAVACNSTIEDEYIVPDNATVIMHLNDPFPYIEIRDPQNNLLKKIDVLPEDNHIEITHGD